MKLNKNPLVYHLLLLVTLLPIVLVNSQVTIFDKLGIGHLRQAREFLLAFSGRTGHNEADFRTNLRNNVSQSRTLSTSFYVTSNLHFLLP